MSYRSTYSLRHVLGALLLVMLQLGARRVETIAYRVAIRPALLRAGAFPCDSIGDRPPIANCDLVFNEWNGSITRRTYYSHDGSVRATTFIGATPTSSLSTQYWGNASLIVLPICATVVVFIATLRKMLRTRSFWTWQLARHRWDLTEKMLLFYAIPVLVIAMVQLSIRW